MDERHEKILERFMRLGKRTCVRMRPDFPRHGRWYLSLERVCTSSLPHGGHGSWFSNGETPEQSLEKAWNEMQEMFDGNSNLFFLIYTCADNVPIPGDTPQIWVRWNAANDDWEDVVPTEEALLVRNIPRNRIRSYSEHCWRQKL